MRAYKNTGIITKTFYGVTFNPGESKCVEGFINDPSFIIVSAELSTSNIKGDKVEKPVKQKEAKQKSESVEDSASSM